MASLSKHVSKKTVEKEQGTGRIKMEITISQNVVEMLALIVILCVLINVGIRAFGELYTQIREEQGFIQFKKWGNHRKRDGVLYDQYDDKWNQNKEVIPSEIIERPLNVIIKTRGTTNPLEGFSLRESGITEASTPSHGGTPSPGNETL